MKAKFSSVFENDFAEIITRFAGEISPELSIRFENRIAAAFERIVRHPEIGRRRKDLRQAGIRSFRVAGFESYLIFYQARTDDVFFIRVLHGSMNLPAMFPEA
ncbi:MAG TPA: type II toxin-antitoxin system RelE/ParE family toxin [Verrucomicrobiae bacterium]|jgi:plasmid stabilization system protein ParE|nr:type II toxin-antitoxin system RelE/ParE family toxin [Verrucomicrobiae bacterium]